MPVSAARVLRVIADEEQTDAELLRRFIDRRDEAAFALLVRRHGAMVYGVCRRMLPEQDAEDAFQATFLVLAEKARAAAPREVANWLYGVARRAALLSRRSIARRRERTGDMPDRPAEPDPMAELRVALDEELSRLPDIYRLVIVLCDLEGRTRREAAAVLGCPEGTVAGRLVRARELLAKRMARHAPVVSLAAVLAGTASARVPEVLSPTAAIPPGVAALTREVLGAMTRGKLMKVVVAVLLLGCAGFGMVLAGQKPATMDAPARPGSTEAPKDPPKSDDVVWGKEVDGLQAGLVTDVRTYLPGETIKLQVKLRNVGKADITFTYGRLHDTPPKISDAGGADVSVGLPPLKFSKVRKVEKAIKPGETITLYKPEVALIENLVGQDAPVQLLSIPTVQAKPGKYTIAFGGMLEGRATLSTGAVQFEVKDTKPAAEIAWGDEVNGLQAGIGFTSDVRKIYRVGEKIAFLVKLRNPGREAVNYNAHFNPLAYAVPVVRDATGKAVTVTPGHRPESPSTSRPTLKAGQEINFGGTNNPGKPVGHAFLALQPFDVRRLGNAPHFINVPPGKYTISFTGILHSPKSLATGFVEFEVLEARPDDKETIAVSAPDGLRELKGKDAEAYHTKSG